MGATMGLSHELIHLAAAIIIGIVTLIWAAATARGQQNLAWAAGARDEAVAPPGKLAGRLDRAQANLFETLPIFAIAVIMAHVAGKDGGPLTLWGTHLYLFGRVIYLPLYALGVAYIRTLAWGVAFVGMGMVIAALFV